MKYIFLVFHYGFIAYGLLPELSQLRSERSRGLEMPSICAVKSSASKIWLSMRMSNSVSGMWMRCSYQMPFNTGLRILVHWPESIVFVARTRWVQAAHLLVRLLTWIAAHVTSQNVQRSQASYLPSFQNGSSWKRSGMRCLSSWKAWVAFLHGRKG